MEENITVIKTAMGALTKDQVAWQVTTLLSEFLKQFNE